MAMIDGDGLARDIRVAAGTTRRVLVAAGAGWVLSAAGLFLPASGDEADARAGVNGGALGGRHGKDQRGVNKHRRKQRRRNNAGRDGQTTHDEGLFTKNVALNVWNNTATDVQVKYFSGDSGPRRWSTVPTVSLDAFKGDDSKISATIYKTSGCPDPSTEYDDDPSTYYPPECEGWAFALWLENPDIGAPNVTITRPGPARDMDYLVVTQMSEGDRIDKPEYGFWIERQGDNDYKWFTFGVY